jgi:pyruvate/2-oxoglutarate dehydrogenase complex dihydrolipoamide dehydrogenase (E3) component
LDVLGDGSVSELTGVDAVLQAVGRERNLAGLGLEQLGVAFDASGIQTDSFGRTNVPGLFAIGDVTSTAHTTHAANAQGRRVSQAIALPFLPSRAPEPAYPEAIFCDPEVASIGLSAAKIRARYHAGAVIRVRVDFKDIDRGYTDESGEGFVIIDAIRLTGSILAATVVGPRASEMITVLGLAISKGIGLHGLYRQVYPYPTYSSGIGKAADAFIRATLPPAKLKGELLSYLRYRLARPA